MTNYVILSPNISSVGGAQIYLRNKINFLKYREYKPLIMHASKKNIVIEELKEFKDNCFEFINYEPVLFSKNKINEYLDCLAEKVDMSCEIVIESHTISNALWGELLAEKLNCKHFVYLLNENFPALTEDEYRFFEFKHKRRELVGISVNTIPMLMRGHRSVEADEAYRLPATCSNSVEDIEAEWLDNLKIGEYTIASIGRLDKLYQIKMAEAIVRFALNYPEKLISVILIGGADKLVYEKKLRKIYRRAKNINLHITGFMYPVSKKVFQKIDVFVGTAGGAKAVYLENSVAITTDVTDGYGIGVLGYTTVNCSYRDKNEEKKDICELLDDVLIKKLYANKEPELNVLIPAKVHSNLIDFTSHIDFIDSTSHIKEYYMVNGFKKFVHNKKRNIHRIVVTLIGYKIYSKLMYLYFILKNLK